MGGHGPVGEGCSQCWKEPCVCKQTAVEAARDAWKERAERAEDMAANAEHRLMQERERSKAMSEALRELMSVPEGPFTGAATDKAIAAKMVMRGEAQTKARAALAAWEDK